MLTVRVLGQNAGRWVERRIWAFDCIREVHGVIEWLEARGFNASHQARVLVSAEVSDGSRGVEVGEGVEVGGGISH